MSIDRPNPHDLVPGGAFAYPIATPGPTRWFGFLLLPEFTLLAFGAALDPLRIANQLAQKPLYGWVVITEDAQPVASSALAQMTADTGLTDWGQDLQVLVCSGNHHTEAASDKVLAALRRHARFGGKVGSVCTGASTLARAGLLAGKRFTLHWENQPGFVECFPDLCPTRRRFEIDGDLMTCGGGSAASDMMLSMIAEDHGPDFAIAVADMCLNGADFHARDEQRSSIAMAVGSRNPKVLSVLRAMYAEVEDPTPLNDLAKDAGLSRRQLERQFQKLMGEGPATVYRNIRLDRARTLLMETDLSVMEVAQATGFASTTLLSRWFKARFGISASDQRNVR